MKKKKKIITTGIALFAMIFLGFTHDAKYQGSQLNLDPLQSASQEFLKNVLDVTYTCPMHPKVIRDKPGKCPQCGMKLEIKKVTNDVYTCSMHPKVIQDKAGKCPKCNMKLTRKEPVKKAAVKK